METNTRPPVRMEASWLAQLSNEFEAPYMAKLRSFLAEEMKQYPVYPPGKEIFSAFDFTPFDQVRVVILGQDPYHGHGQANGLFFSVKRGVRVPPSLDNVFRELHSDIGIPRPSHGDLSSWAHQGVLLLNTVLTVRARKANSHRERGWERLTDRAIELLNTQREGLVFVLWGASAGRKSQMIDRSRHLILRCPHPSPHSADRGFFGSRHFSKINDYLTRRGEEPIQWSLPS